MRSPLSIVLVLAIALFSDCAIRSPSLVECGLCRAFSPLVWLLAVFQGLRSVLLRPWLRYFGPLALKSEVATLAFEGYLRGILQLLWDGFGAGS